MGGCQQTRCRCGAKLKACQMQNGMCPKCYAASIKLSK